MNDEPRIDGYAMSADTWPRLQDLDARVPIGKRDEFPYVDAEPPTNEGQLIGKRYVHVAERVLGQLRQLGRAGISSVTVASHEGLIELRRTRSTVRRHAADDPIVS